MSTWLLVYVAKASDRIKSLIKAMETAKYDKCETVYNHILEELENSGEKKLLELDNNKEIKQVKKNWGVDKLPALLLIRDDVIEKSYYFDDIFIDEQVEKNLRMLW